MADLQVGDVFEYPYPFVRYAEKIWSIDVEAGFEGTYTIEDRWKPGIEQRFVHPNDFQDFYDGDGKCRLTVVGVYKPDGFPTRVFFKREWSPPNSEKFYGLNRCRIVSLGRFNQLKRGFHSYSFSGPTLDDKGAEAARNFIGEKGEGNE